MRAADRASTTLGSRLIDLALTRELSGEARLEYPVDGFHCELFVPLEQILVEDSAQPHSVN
jgi:hypothetical protein